MKKQKTRAEIEEKYKWDLTPIYKTEEDWYKDLELAKKEILKIENYKNFIEDAKTFKNFLEYSDYIDRLLLKLYYYANLNHDADTLNDKYQKMLTLITDVMNDYNSLSSFVEPLYMKIDYDKILEFIKEEPSIKEYEFNLKNLFRYKEHTLSELEEKIISELSNSLSNPSDTYEILTDSDIRFGIIKDEENNDIELTNSNYSKYLKSNNRRVRKDAFDLMYKTYSDFKTTLASTYNGDIDTNIALAKIKNYKSALSASLFNDNVDEDVYNNLIKTVNDNLNILFKYYDLKKKKLNLDELHLYDIYVPLISEKSKTYTFEEAKNIVLSALNVLGEDYIKILNKAFDERWIDVYNNVGKRSGAYSSGFYDTNPYLLLNFEGEANDISTLAHELGHSMHTYYSCHNQPYHYSNYKIFVAEVASTVNEILLNKYMINNTNDIDEKKFYLNELLELFKGTIFRQTMFAEFEKGIYEARENKEVLTSEYISNKYYEIVKKYFGPNVICDEQIKYEWARIPHFYYNFYVYKYATSLSAACFIATNILNGEKNALESYLTFLKTGGSMYPIDELKIAGVDMTNKEVIESAIKMFNDTIDEFEKYM